MRFKRWLCGFSICNSSVSSDASIPAAASSSSSLTVIRQKTDGKHDGMLEGKLVLDSAVWSQLPDDLQERVLSFLPVLKLLYFRSVCKRWHSLVVSKSFYELCPTSLEPWFVVISKATNNSVSAYVPSSKKWLKLPSTFLPRSNDYSFHGSAGGLILFRARGDGFRSQELFYVSNPLTGVTRDVSPPILSCASRHAKLVVDEDGFNFRIYKVGKMSHEVGQAGKLSPDVVQTQGNLALEVYESKSESWRVVTRVDIGILAPCDLSVIASFSGPFSLSGLNGTFLYCKFCPLSGILAYDLQKGFWSKIAVPQESLLTNRSCHSWSQRTSTGAMHNCSICRNLSERQGRLMKVVRAMTQEETRRCNARLRDLNEHSQLQTDWSVVGEDIFQSTTCRAFLDKHRDTGVWCYAQGDWVFITAGNLHLLVHNLAEKACHVAPPCPSMASSNALFDNVQAGFPYEPRPNALMKS